MIQQKKIILASQSPRRQELLKQLGIEFDIQVLSIDETYPSDLSPYDVPEYLAKLKRSLWVAINTLCDRNWHF